MDYQRNNWNWWLQQFWSALATNPSYYYYYTAKTAIMNQSIMVRKSGRRNYTSHSSHSSVPAVTEEIDDGMADFDEDGHEIGAPDEPIRNGPKNSFLKTVRSCSQCNSNFYTETTNRPVQDCCGHVKCRSCFIRNEDGCPQCREEERLRALELAGLKDVTVSHSGSNHSDSMPSLLRAEEAYPSSSSHRRNLRGSSRSYPNSLDPPNIITEYCDSPISPTPLVNGISKNYSQPTIDHSTIQEITAPYVDPIYTSEINFKPEFGIGEYPLSEDPLMQADYARSSNKVSSYNGFVRKSTNVVVTLTSKKTRSETNDSESNVSSDSHKSSHSHRFNNVGATSNGLITRAQLKELTDSVPIATRQNLKRNSSKISMTATSSSPTKPSSSSSKLEIKTKSPTYKNTKIAEKISPQKPVEKDDPKSSKSAPKFFRMLPQDREDKKNAAIANTRLNKNAVLKKDTSKHSSDRNKPGRPPSSSLSKSPTTNHREKPSRLSSLRSSTSFNDNNQPSSSTQSSKTTPEKSDKKAEVNTVVGYQKDNVRSMTKGFPTLQLASTIHAKTPVAPKTPSPSKPAITVESSTDSKVKTVTFSGIRGKRPAEENVNAPTQSNQSSSKSSEEPSPEVKKKKKRSPVLIHDHITVLQGDPPMYQCNVCMKKFKTKAHIKYHEFCQNGEKPFKCDQCGQGFIAKSHYEYHLRTHTGERPYVCPKCGKGFNQRGKVTRHMRSHTGEKPFVCQECGRGFANAQALRSHYLIHTGERPFACHYCNKRFTGMTNLKKHIITHTGERPFTCVHCSKSFGLKWTLDLHLRTHSSERPYACDQCSRAFSNSKDLRRHLVIHSGERPFKCWICGTSFRRKDNLDRHIKNTHNQPKEVAKQLANEAAAEYLALSRTKNKQQQDQSNDKVVKKLPETVTNATPTNSIASQHVKQPIKSKPPKQIPKNVISEEEELIVSDPIPQLSMASAIETADSYILPNNQIDIPKGSLHLEYTIDTSKLEISCLEMDGLTELQSVPVAEYTNLDLETIQLLEKTKPVSSEEEDTEHNKRLEGRKSDSEIAASIAAAVNSLDADVDGWDSLEHSTSEIKREGKSSYQHENEEDYEEEEEADRSVNEKSVTEETENPDEEPDVTVTVVYDADGTTHFIGQDDELKESSPAPKDSDEADQNVFSESQNDDEPLDDQDDDDEQDDERTHVLGLPSEITTASESYELDDPYSNTPISISPETNMFCVPLENGVDDSYASSSNDKSPNEVDLMKAKMREKSPDITAITEVTKSKVESNCYLDDCLDDISDDELPLEDPIDDDDEDEDDDDEGTKESKSCHSSLDKDNHLSKSFLSNVSCILSGSLTKLINTTNNFAATKMPTLVLSTALKTMEKTSPVNGEGHSSSLSNCLPDTSVSKLSKEISLDPLMNGEIDDMLEEGELQIVENTDTPEDVEMDKTSSEEDKTENDEINVEEKDSTMTSIEDSFAGNNDILLNGSTEPISPPSIMESIRFTETTACQPTVSPKLPSVIMEKDDLEEGELVDDDEACEEAGESYVKRVSSREIGQQTEFDPEFGEPLSLATKEYLPSEHSKNLSKPQCDPSSNFSVISDRDKNVGTQLDCPHKFSDLIDYSPKLQNLRSPEVETTSVVAETLNDITTRIVQSKSSSELSEETQTSVKSSELIDTCRLMSSSKSPERETSSIASVKVKESITEVTESKLAIELSEESKILDESPEFTDFSSNIPDSTSSDQGTLNVLAETQDDDVTTQAAESKSVTDLTEESKTPDETPEFTDISSNVPDSVSPAQETTKVSAEAQDDFTTQITESKSVTDLTEESKISEESPEFTDIPSNVPDSVSPAQETTKVSAETQDYVTTHTAESKSVTDLSEESKTPDESPDFTDMSSNVPDSVYHAQDTTKVSAETQDDDVTTQITESKSVTDLTEESKISDESSEFTDIPSNVPDSLSPAQETTKVSAETQDDDVITHTAESKSATDLTEESKTPDGSPEFTDISSSVPDSVSLAQETTKVSAETQDDVTTQITESKSVTDLTADSKISDESPEFIDISSNVPDSVSPAQETTKVSPETQGDDVTTHTAESKSATDLTADSKILDESPEFTDISSNVPDSVSPAQEATKLSSETLDDDATTKIAESKSVTDLTADSNNSDESPEFTDISSNVPDSTSSDQGTLDILAETQDDVVTTQTAESKSANDLTEESKTPDESAEFTDISSNVADSVSPAQETTKVSAETQDDEVITHTAESKSATDLSEESKTPDESPEFTDISSNVADSVSPAQEATKLSSETLDDDAATQIAESKSTSDLSEESEIEDDPSEPIDDDYKLTESPERETCNVFTETLNDITTQITQSISQELSVGFDIPDPYSELMDASCNHEDSKSSENEPSTLVSEKLNEPSTRAIESKLVSEESEESDIPDESSEFSDSSSNLPDSKSPAPETANASAETADVAEDSEAVNKPSELIELTKSSEVETCSVVAETLNDIITQITEIKLPVDLSEASPIPDKSPEVSQNLLEAKSTDEEPLTSESEVAEKEQSGKLTSVETPTTESATSKSESPLLQKVTCRFDFDGWHSTIVSRERRYSVKSPVNFPNVESEITTMTINPLRRKRLKEYYRNVISPPAAEPNQSTITSKEVAAKSSKSNNSKNRKILHAKRRGTSTVSTSKSDSSKEKVSDSKSQQVQKKSVPHSYSSPCDIRTKRGLIYSQASVNSQSSTMTSPSVTNHKYSSYSKHSNISPVSSTTESNASGVRFIYDNAAFSCPVNPANIHYVLTSDEGEEGSQSRKQFGNDVQVVYAAAAATVDNTPDEGDTGPPSKQSKVRLLYAEAIGIQKGTEFTDNNQVQLLYAATTPNQQVVNSPNPHIRLDHPRLINSNDIGNGQGEQLQMVIAPPHPNYIANMNTIPVEVSYNGHTAVAQSVIRKQENISLINQARAMHRWYPSITTHPQYDLGMQSYSSPHSSEYRPQQYPQPQLTNNSTPQTYPTHTSTYSTSTVTNAPLSNSSPTSSDLAREIEVDSASKWKSNDKHVFSMPAPVKDYRDVRHRINLNTLANAAVEYHANSDRARDATSNAAALRNKAMQDDTERMSRAAAAIAAVGLQAKQARLREMRERKVMVPHRGPRKQYLSKSSNFRD